MFEIAVHALALSAFYLSCADHTCQIAVFGVVFEVPSADRRSVSSGTGGIPALDIDAKSVFPDAAAEFQAEIRIPRCSEHLLVRIAHRVHIAHNQLTGNACRAVLIGRHRFADAVDRHGLPAAQAYHFHHLGNRQAVEDGIPTFVVPCFPAHGNEIDILAGACHGHLGIGVFLKDITLADGDKVFRSL